MFQLPTRVKIGPIDYTVEVRQSLAAEQMFGQILYTEGRIEMNPSVTPQMQEVTFWHEVFHGMLLHSGVREHDEQVLDVLAHGLVAIKQQHPELFQ